MAAEMVKVATSDKLKDMDWMKNIEICELVARDPGYVTGSDCTLMFKIISDNSSRLFFCESLTPC